MSLVQSQFEDFVRAHNPLMITKADSPALWHGSKDAIKKYEENPYAHPWTVGAWEGWKAATAASEKRIKELEQLLAQEQSKTVHSWSDRTLDSNRQTGRTTKQMLEAPQNAAQILERTMTSYDWWMLGVLFGYFYAKVLEPLWTGWVAAAMDRWWK